MREERERVSEFRRYRINEGSQWKGLWRDGKIQYDPGVADVSEIRRDRLTDRQEK